jgi:hypothetical protein
VGLNQYCLVYKVIDGKIKEITEYLDTELVSRLSAARLSIDRGVCSCAIAGGRHRILRNISKFVSAATQLVRRQPFDSATPARQRGKTG